MSLVGLILGMGTAVAFNDQEIGLLLDVDAELITEADFLVS